MRRLFAVATENVPPGIVAATAAITLSAVQAPSAFAQVTHAAPGTAAASYRVRSVEK